MGKIVLMESHPLLRLGLWQIVKKLGEPWEIVELDYDALAKGESPAIGVDLLIYGVSSGAGSDRQYLTEIHKTLQPKRILLLADALPLPPSFSNLSGLPVSGCVMKTVSVEILEAAIRLVIAGGQCFPGKQLQAPDSYFRPAADQAGGVLSSNGLKPAGSNGKPNEISIAEGAQLLQLTPRQYEVLVLLARGHPIKTISRMLNISVATTKTHACTLYQRLHVRNKGEAVYTALKRGATLEWHGPELDRDNKRVQPYAHTHK
ncbi:response regulator transcription factor [uncultured Pigmentiphaga sp.]|uniref:response regulator transcription factor n=1 Tax=uncultured Pigmentiphaga sp. TaxID=340361 RepID=UPI0026302420|nr:response regulator transcription factor [uncultured Pigmentiphaga sp.]